MITSSSSYCHGYSELPAARPCYLRDAIEGGQRPAIFVRVGKPSAAQRRTFSRDKAAPDAMLADSPPPQRQLQARGAHGAGRADSDRAGRLRFGTDRKPFVGIERAIGALRLPHDLGAQRPIGQLRLSRSRRARNVSHAPVSLVHAT
jgi:hypothetical protein